MARTTKSVSAMDKLTIKDLDIAIAALKARTDPKAKLSQKTKNVAQSMLNKYSLQKAKTLKLYEKNKNKIKGVSKSTLSVQKIYQILNPDITEFKERGAVAEFMLGNKAENLLSVIGGGVAIGGLLSMNNAAGFEAIGTALKNMFTAMYGNGVWNAIGSTALLAGGGLLAFNLAKKAIRRTQYANAIEKGIAEDKINEGTVKGLTGNEKDTDEIIPSLAAQAAAGSEVDNETFIHLMNVASNPYNDPKVIKVANKILAQARTLRAQNYARIQANLLETNLLSGNEIEVGISSSGAPVFSSSRTIVLNKIKRENLRKLQSSISIVDTRTSSNPNTYKLTGSPLPTGMTADDLTNLINYSKKPTLDEAEKAALDNAISMTDADFIAKYKGYVGSEDMAKEIIYMLRAKKQIKSMEASGEYSSGTPEKIGGVEVDTIDNQYDRALVEAAHNSGFDLASLGINMETSPINYKDAAKKIRAKHPALIQKILTTANEQILGAENAILSESSK